MAAPMAFNLWLFQSELSVLLIVVICMNISRINGYTALVDASPPERCIGRYCGRMIKDDGNFSECGPCERGYVVNTHGVCEPCTGAPTFYDWLYLSFLPITAFGLHVFFIELTNRKKTGRLIILHLSALAETALASLLAVLVMRPRGSLSLTSCPVQRLSDWYSLFYNPTKDYVVTIFCTQEIIHPLYTLGFGFILFADALVLLLRLPLSVNVAHGRGRLSIYAALWCFPMLAGLHAALAGFVYYSFAYIVLVVSVVMIAVHFSRFRHQSSLLLLKTHVTDLRNFVILSFLWLLHAFGLVALTRLEDPTLYGPLFCLVPLPAVFYVLTVRYSDPSKLDVV